MFLESLLTNPILTGIFGGSLAASLLYALKGVPQILWDMFLWKFTSSVYISNDDAAFEIVSEWMSKQDFSKKTRHLRMTSEYADHEQQTVLQLSPGLGRHWFWHNNRPILIKRDSSGGATDRFGRLNEYFRISTLGSNPGLLREVMSIIGRSRQDASAYVEVFLYQSYWRKVSRKEKRPLDSVVLPAEQKKRIVGDIEKFLSSKEWYRKLGVPYRRGMLFTGPPGTGKTSLVLALAGLFGMRVYAINLGSLRGDADLLEAISGVPERAILLIEDIDVAQAKRSSDEPKTTAATPPADPNVKESKPAEAEVPKVSLSGLLNAIDGVFSRDGRLLIMTTNYPERLDNALKRPGRADLIERLGELEQEEVKTMCRQFLNGSGDAFAKTVKSPITPAELQKLLFQQAASTRDPHVN